MDKLDELKKHRVEGFDKEAFLNRYKDNKIEGVDFTIDFDPNGEPYRMFNLNPKQANNNKAGGGNMFVDLKSPDHQAKRVEKQKETIVNNKDYMLKLAKDTEERRQLILKLSDVTPPIDITDIDMQIYILIKKYIGRTSINDRGDIASLFNLFNAKTGGKESNTGCSTCMQTKIFPYLKSVYQNICEIMEKNIQISQKNQEKYAKLQEILTEK